MKFIFVLGIFICNFKTSNTELKTGISKVICTMKRPIHTEIYFGSKTVSYQVMLMKNVFQECNLKLKVVSKFIANERTNLIAFCYDEKDLKVNLYSLAPKQ